MEEKKSSSWPKKSESGSKFNVFGSATLVDGSGEPRTVHTSLECTRSRRWCTPAPRGAGRTSPASQPSSSPILTHIIPWSYVNRVKGTS